ncbi:MAG: hypothetical protein CMH46_05455 [Muricauda sp.]|nr:MULTISPECIES: hypothetical protein [unclassified Allomuricauda]MAU14969.1 hypothetical protein [Allomuricauda sp.]|tara:strand:+ start:14494 stop:16710 length:2217 start_codon:yes stop_codon:yes gene_type:complete
MKIPYKNFILPLIVLALIFGCSSNEDANELITDDDAHQKDEDPVGSAFDMVDVQVLLPEDSSVDLTNGTVVLLGANSDIDANGTASLPLNGETIEVAYLLDADNNVLLAGFISDERKELSVETTAEIMLYYALGYYLLPDSAKGAFLKSVGQVPGFSNFVEEIQTLYIDNPLMYSEGSYESTLQNFLDQITSKSPTGIENRIFFNDESTKSGVILSSVDSTRIKLQNSLPRRSNVIIYKKSYTDRNGDLFDIPDYTSSTLENFELEAGKTNKIETLELGNSVQQINAQQASIENVVQTDPILLPVNPATEFVAEYEVVVIGSGQDNSEDRNMTEDERNIYAEINKKTYVIDYFLPTLLDISGNKSLLPPFGSDKEDALFNAVLPVLEEYPDVIEEVVDNEFKEATNIFLPALYEDIRLSNDLRTILQDVYNILSGNGDFPNTFIQDHELIETGYQRTKVILAVVDRNIKTTNYYANFGSLRTTAFNFESWDVKSIDAVVEMQKDNVELCLGQATELRVTAITDIEPDLEEFEFHWSTSNEYGGRVQDIADDPNNFGQSIITKLNYVSYISTALESELGSGDNNETITVILYIRNKNTGELTEAGRDTMTVNNKKGCESFTVSFTRLPNIKEIPNSGCPNNISYQAFSPIPYAADFAAVEGATGYKGIITSSNGVVNQERVLDESQLEDIGDGMLRFTSGVGSIIIYESCDQAEAEARAQEMVDNISVEPASIEITPIF